MVHSLFHYLAWANPKNIANSSEETFYDKNANLFNLALSKYNDNTSLFGIIRANIILQGLKTKHEVDHNINLFSKEMLSDEEVTKPFFQNAPYLLKDGKKIFIPTYSVEINERYLKETSSLKETPYSALVMDGTSSLVDPFETYGNDLFDSMFTRLVRLEVHEVDSACFYHPTFKTVFVINDDGTLQQEIPLFDEKVRKPNYTDLFNRLEQLMKIYYQNDRDGFLEALLRLELISQDLHDEIVHEVQKGDKQKRKIQK